MNYVEFRLSVTIADLHDEEGQDCDELRQIAKIINVDLLKEPLSEHYDGYYDYTASHPGPRVRADTRYVLKFVANDDDQAFLSIDMFLFATDQMNMVRLGVRCGESDAVRIETLLRSIREKAEIYAALLQGKLGLAEEMDVTLFPRARDNNGKTVLQHIIVFRAGSVLITR